MSKTHSRGKIFRSLTIIYILLAWKSFCACWEVHCAGTKVKGQSMMHLVQSCDASMWDKEVYESQKTTGSKALFGNIRQTIPQCDQEMVLPTRVPWEFGDASKRDTCCCCTNKASRTWTYCAASSTYHPSQEEASPVAACGNCSAPHLPVTPEIGD